MISVLSFMLLTVVSSCAHISSSGVKSYSIRNLIPYTLKVRRPSTPGIDPKVGPGGVDYRARVLPDEHYDCRDITWLFKDVDLAKLRACLSTEKPSQAFYLLRRQAIPFVELENDSETLPCLAQVLPTIPLPREIFFQSTEGERLACYSTRLEIESDELAGFKMPMDRKGVKLEFPLESPPKDDNETRMLLMTWALTSFWNPDKTLTSILVPDRICEQCLGRKTMLKPTDPEPILWPEAE